MQRILNRAVLAFACLATAMTLTISAQAGPADGTWTWSQPGRGGGEPRPVTLKLKTEGDKITGSMSPMRDGGEDIKISEGTIKGDEIAFKVERPGRDGGPAQVTKYAGKITGDTLKGKITRTRQGEETSTDWEAKKKADAK